MKRLRVKRSFRKEFKRQLRYGIVLGVSFLIAYSWREAIWNSSHKLIERFVETTQSAASDFLTSVAISVVGVFIILLSSKLLSEK